MQGLQLTQMCTILFYLAESIRTARIKIVVGGLMTHPLSVAAHAQA